MRRLELAQGKQTPEEAFVDAILYGKRQCFQGTPKILSFYPEAHNNPFQELLYREASSFEVVPLGFSDFEHLGCLNWGEHSFLHIHWVKKILQEARSSKEAKERLQNFFRRVLELKKRGHKIIWTVHNVFPHETKYRGEERELRAFLAEEAHKIHGMTEDTPDRCQSFFHLSKKKFFYTPHPFYEGVYPGESSRLEARYKLSISHERVFLVFGSLDPYKKIHLFLEELAKSELSQCSGNLFLLVGKIFSKDYLNCLEHLAAKVSARVKIVPKQVSVDQVELYFKASDAVFIPYHETLNSGVVALAATFRKLILTKRSSSAESILGSGYPHFVDNFSEDTLVKELEKWKKNPLSDLYWEEREKLSKPSVVSRAFFKKIIGGFRREG